MLRALAIALIGALSSGVSAQETGDVGATEQTVVQSAILTVDLDRLYTQSQFGERIVREYTEQREALGLENRRIAEALREEELALAAARPEMELELFQSEAEAFDEKAQGIRRAQDAKERALETFLTDGREQFFVVIGPILQRVAAERGASAILDRRAVLISIEGTDVTDEAIARINDSIGDGLTPEN